MGMACDRAWELVGVRPGRSFGYLIPSLCSSLLSKCLAQILTSGVAAEPVCSVIGVKFYMALSIYEVVYSQLNSFMKLIF